MKLRTKILSYTLPLILIPFLLTAIAVYYFVIQANQVQIQEQNNQRLNEVIVSFGQEIDAVKKDIDLLASVPAIIDYLEKNSSTTNNRPESEAKTILELFFKQNPYYLNLSLVNDKGFEIVKFSKLTKERELKSIKNEDYFKRTLITGNVQTPVREIQANKFVTIFTNSITKNEEFLGLLVLTLNTEIFERSLRPLINSDLNTFLFDDRGLVFAESFRSKEEKLLLKKVELSADAAKMLADTSFEIRLRSISNENNEFLLSVLPSESFAGVQNFEQQAGSNWFLGVLEPQKSTPIPIVFQVTFFSILFLTIGAVLFLTAKAASYITIPLEKVSTATSKIARGETDLELDIRTGDEVEDLANAVRSMNFELKDYQKQLVQAAKLATMGEMTSEISHEIQNRISGISLWLQHLDSEIEKDDPRQEYLDEMKQGLNGFMEMLANLKEYYKTPALDLKEVDLNLIVQESMHFVEEKAKENSIEINKVFSSDLPKTSGDEEKLKSVIINLLVNAIDSITEKGIIEVKTELDKELFIEIKDNGKGIAEDDLSRIFYPFYSKKSGGSGLGLAISSNIISAHKGHIRVQSEVGKGTTFKVLLPLNN